LSGNIPNFNLPYLKGLYLQVNQLTGSIPNFNLPNLEELQLQVNQLSGTIPNFNLPNLQGLSLQQNLLTGAIPQFSLSNLKKLDLSWNHLTGSIPLFNTPNLTGLSVANNDLTGTIPLFAYSYLTILDLRNNYLQGCIPSGIKVKCPRIGATGGNISNNPNLATQSWENYWNLNQGACTTSTTDLKETSLTISPNPTNDWFTIRYEVMPNEILVYNSLGRLLQNIVPAPEQVQMDISGYSEGVYFVKIYDKMHKIVKN
jgi:uncharacterized protein YjbI with pentapeptide repeats